MNNGRKASRPSVIPAGLACVAGGMFSAMSFMVSPEGYMGLSAVPAASTSYLWSALALAFAMLYGYTYIKRACHLGVLLPGLGLLFGVLNYFGTYLFAYDTWSFERGFPGLLQAGAQCVGQGLVMAAFLTLVDDVLRAGCLTQNPVVKSQWEKFSRVGRFFRNHTTLCCALCFGVCWCPYLMIFYPGSFSWDMGEMAAQFFGLRQMDTWHPVLTTWVLGGCLWLGRLVGSDNLGALLFMLLQTAALAWALGYSVHVMRRMGASRIMQIVGLIFWGLVPIWGSYVQFICKDTLYTAMLMVFTLQSIQLLWGVGEKPSRWIVGYGLTALITCLLRSNGIYIVMPTSLFMIMGGVQGRPKWPVTAALGSALVIAVLFSSVFLPALHIKDETASGLYSVCFQQSARVLRDHAESITPQEYEELDIVLDAQNLPVLYEPLISDPVKYTFKAYGQGAEAEKLALNRYRETWFSMLKKYPLTYLEAFFAGNSGYYAFLPKLEGETYNNQAGNRFVFETHPQVATHLDVHISHIPQMEGLRNVLAMAARGIRHIPLLSLLYCCAFYTWILAGAGASMVRQRRWRMLIGFLPAVLTLGTCILSPVNDYFRYFLPVVALTLPLLVLADAGVRDPWKPVEEFEGKCEKQIEE